MIYEIIIGFCVCVFLWKMWSRNRSLGQPPELSGRLPIIGHLHQFLCDGVGMFNLMEKMAVECRQKGDLVTIDLGFRKLYGLSDPEDCFTIANTCLNKDKVYDFGRPFLGNGLIISSEQIWKKHRKLLNPAFSQHALNSFVGTFNSQARLLVELFAKELGKPFDHEEPLRLNNLETICLTTSGFEGHEYGDLRKQYLALLSKVVIIFTERFRRPWLQSELIFKMSKLKKKQDESIKSITELSKKIIEMKRAEKKSNKSKNVDNESEKIKPFIEWILDIAKDTGCFTDDEIREETDNIIVAGHDTSASILTFVFTLLGSFPQVQDKVYDEILHVLGNTDRDIDKDDLSKLIYTDAVIKETVRLYPITSIIARYTDKPVKLKNYTVEANTGCFITISGINRHPMWGPDADQFRPERWLDLATLPDSKYFAAFGLGRRACIGKVYAMMSMKIVVAHVVRRYRISGDVTKMVLKWDVTTRPVSGHHITLNLRN